MNHTDGSKIGFEQAQVERDGEQLVIRSRVEVRMPMPASDEHLPQRIEEAVDRAGQQVKREFFRMAMEKADGEVVWENRHGQSGQGARRRGEKR